MKNLQTTWKLVGDGLQLGSSIPFAILIGFALGYWLDGKFDTSPYLSIIFLLFGIAAAGRNVMIELRKQRRSEYSGRTNGI
ncbi:MAG: AtpZ/AtpI family protein [Pseudomonadota bacterium]